MGPTRKARASGSMDSCDGLTFLIMGYNMTIHGRVSLSTTEGVLAGTLAVAAGFAAGKMGSNMDPALKALDDYASATHNLKGITLTQEEKDSNTANIQSPFSLFTGRLQDIHQGTTFDEAAYAAQVATVQKALMDQISAVTSRGSEGPPAKKAKVESAAEQAASYDEGGHVLPQPKSSSGHITKAQLDAEMKTQSAEGAGQDDSVAGQGGATNLIQTSQNVKPVKPNKNGGGRH